MLTLDTFSKTLRLAWFHCRTFYRENPRGGFRDGSGYVESRPEPTRIYRLRFHRCNSCTEPWSCGDLLYLRRGLSDSYWAWCHPATDIETYDSPSGSPLASDSDAVHPLQMAVLSNPEYPSSDSAKLDTGKCNLHNVRIEPEGENLWTKVQGSSRGWYFVFMWVVLLYQCDLYCVLTLTDMIRGARPLRDHVATVSAYLNDYKSQKDPEIHNSIKFTSYPSEIMPPRKRIAWVVLCVYVSSTTLSVWPLLCTHTHSYDQGCKAFERPCCDCVCISQWLQEPKRSRNTTT